MKKKSFFKKILGIGLIIFIIFKLFNFLALDRYILSGSDQIEVYKNDNYIELEGISSKNAIVIDRKTGEIIGGKLYDEKIHPASMTKVMTALVGIENIHNLNKRIKIGQEVIDYCIINGLSVSGFEAGDSPKIIDLLYGILLESGGESSISLANYISGSEEEFVKLMNEKARELNMNNTNFGNATGITSNENYSTVEDMGILFRYAISNKKFRTIVETNTYEAKGLRGPFSKHEINNQLFFKRNSMDISKEYIRAGKTGYTEAAGLCLVSLGEISSREYIVVVAGANGNPQTEQLNLRDTSKIYEKLKKLR